MISSLLYFQDLLKFRIEEALHVIEVEEKISKFCKRMAEFVPGLMPETRDFNELFLSDVEPE